MSIWTFRTVIKTLFVFENTNKIIQWNFLDVKDVRLTFMVLENSVLFDMNSSHLQLAHDCSYLTAYNQIATNVISISSSSSYASDQTLVKTQFRSIAVSTCLFQKKKSYMFKCFESRAHLNANKKPKKWITNASSGTSRSTNGIQMDAITRAWKRTFTNAFAITWQVLLF